jgi:hypothetical protein
MSSVAHTDEDSNLYLGEEYKWASAPSMDGTTVLDFQGQTANVTRTPETDTKPAIWKLEHIDN